MRLLTALWADTASMRGRMRRAAPSTLLVHAVTSLCAAGFALPLAASVREQALAEQPAVGALFTAVRLFDALTGSPLRFGGLPALVLLIVAPFLQVLWLRAQLLAAPIYEHARSAASVYKQACAVYLASAAYASLLLASAVVLARGFELLLGFTHNVRLQQTSALLVATPLVLAALLHAPSLCDRTQLALAHGERLNRELLIELVRAVDLRLCCTRAGFAVVTASLVLVSLLPRLWMGTSPGAAVWLFLVAQLTAAVRTLVRAAWLAWLVERTEAQKVASDGGGATSPQESASPVGGRF